MTKIYGVEYLKYLYLINEWMKFDLLIIFNKSKFYIKKTNTYQINVSTKHKINSASHSAINHMRHVCGVKQTFVFFPIPVYV